MYSGAKGKPLTLRCEQTALHFYLGGEKEELQAERWQLEEDEKVAGGTVEAQL